MVGKNHSRKCKPFVANRISEIRRLSAPGKWNHVKTKENPAHLVSRGMAIEDLALSDLWWNGPENLKVSVKPSIGRSSEVQEEKVIQVVMMLVVMQSDTPSFWRLNLKRHSS